MRVNGFVTCFRELHLIERMRLSDLVMKPALHSNISICPAKKHVYLTPSVSLRLALLTLFAPRTQAPSIPSDPQIQALNLELQLCAEASTLIDRIPMSFGLQEVMLCLTIPMSQDFRFHRDLLVILLNSLHLF